VGGLRILVRRAPLRSWHRQILGSDHRCFLDHSLFILTSVAALYVLLQRLHLTVEGSSLRTASSI
jgi:hypothetical protein